MPSRIIPEIRADSSFCLTFPVANFREIKREVLKFGSQMVVLSPASLRKEVKKRNSENGDHLSGTPIIVNRVKPVDGRPPSKNSLIFH